MREKIAIRGKANIIYFLHALENCNGPIASPLLLVVDKSNVIL